MVVFEVHPFEGRGAVIERHEGTSLKRSDTEDGHVTLQSVAAFSHTCISLMLRPIYAAKVPFGA